MKDIVKDEIAKNSWFLHNQKTPLAGSTARPVAPGERKYNQIVVVVVVYYSSI